MSLRLYLMRHAIAESLGAKNDIERLLTPDGESQAKQAAEFISNYKIDKIIVSYVKRTMQTFSIIQDKINVLEVETVVELYKEGEDSVLEMLCCQNGQHENILIIGHNPTIFNIAIQLADPLSPRYDYIIDTGMPPARIIALNFPDINSWQGLHKGRGQIFEVFTI